GDIRDACFTDSLEDLPHVLVADRPVCADKNPRLRDLHHGIPKHGDYIRRADVRLLVYVDGTHVIGREPLDVDDYLTGILFRLLRILSHGELDLPVTLHHFRGADRHEEDQQHEKNVDHRSNLELRI